MPSSFCSDFRRKNRQPEAITLLSLKEDLRPTRAQVRIPISFSSPRRVNQGSVILSIRHGVSLAAKGAVGHSQPSST